MDMKNKLLKRIIELANIPLTESISGEWWIIDGTPVFADVDVNDMSHEAIVIQRISSEILDVLGIQLEMEEVGPLSETYYQEKIKETIFQEDISELSEQEQKEWLKNFDAEEEIKKYIKKHDIEIEDLEDKLNVAFGWVDARDYGVKKLGWKRIKGNNIQTWTLTESDLDDIASAYYEIANEEVENETFNIEVSSSGKFYKNVPWSVIDSKNVIEIAGYEN
jgi:hypothetical protein